MTECARPCPTCPFRSENRGKPTPGFALVDEWADRGGWYGLYNMRRAWGGIRDGELFNCHSMDPGQSRKAPAGASGRTLCAGALELVRRELAWFGTSGEDGKPDVAAYLRGNLFQRLSKGGLIEWATRAAFGRTGGMFGGDPIPRVLADVDTVALPEELHGRTANVTRRRL